MAKRSTIGENPLDSLVAENSLDTVVPGPAAASRAAKMEERLERLEAGVSGLQAELAGVKALAAEAARAKGEAARVQTEMAGLKGELERLKTASPGQAEVAAAKGRSRRPEGGGRPTSSQDGALGYSLVDGWQKKVASLKAGVSGKVLAFKPIRNR